MIGFWRHHTKGVRWFRQRNEANHQAQIAADRMYCLAANTPYNSYISSVRSGHCHHIPKPTNFKIAKAGFYIKKDTNPNKIGIVTL